MRFFITFLSFIMLMVTIMAAPVSYRNSHSIIEAVDDFEPAVEVGRYTRDASAESKEQSSEESEGSGEQVNRYTRDTSAESKEQSSEESEGSGEQSDRLRRDASSSEEEGSGADKDTEAELVATKVTFM